MQPVGRWSKVEAASRGLVCGPAVLASAGPAAGLLVRDGLVRPSLAIDGLRAFTGWVPWRKTYKIVVRARDGGEVLWVRPFETEFEAVLAWGQLLRADLDRVAWLPGRWVEGELAYHFLTIETFNSTPGGGTWTVPTGVTEVEYLVIASGGSGGQGDGNGAGGGGAGGYRTASGYAVTPAATPTLTVGTSVAGATSAGSSGTDGVDSVFDSITSGGGGKGAGNSGSAGAGRATNGNGGGANRTSPSSPGAGNGAGFAGGNANNTDRQAAGGGGGSSEAGANATATAAGKGGDGTLSSITGSSVRRAGGGGGGCRGGGTAGAAGLGGGGAGKAAGSGTNGDDGTANTGGGGGGSGGASDGTSSGNGGASGSGVNILSYEAPGHPVVKRFGGVPFASSNRGVW